MSSMHIPAWIWGMTQTNCPAQISCIAAPETRKSGTVCRSESDPLPPLAYFMNCSKHICSTMHMTNWSPNGASVTVPWRIRKCTNLWRRLTTNLDCIVLYCIVLSCTTVNRPIRAEEVVTDALLKRRLWKKSMQDDLDLFQKPRYTY